MQSVATLSTTWTISVASVDPNSIEKYRHIAIKLYAFKVIEGLSTATVTVPSGTKLTNTYHGNKEIDMMTKIMIYDDTLFIERHPVGAPGSPDTAIYRGPIKWLKGVVDYDGEDALTDSG